MKSNYKKGFTLVEVIVVLVILAILAAILIPSLTKYIDKANEKAAIAECRSAVCAAQTISSEQYGSKSFSAAAVSEAAGEITELAKVKGAVSDISVSEKAVITGLKYTAPSNIVVIYDNGEYIIDGQVVGEKTNVEKAQNGALGLLDGSVLPDIIDYMEWMKRTKDSINSTGENFAPGVNQKLNALGIETDNSSWRIWFDTSSKTYQIYWSETNIAGSDVNVGDSVPYVKYVYNYETGELSSPASGTAKVAFDKNKGIRVLDPSGGTSDSEYGTSWN